jgi:hypothetical protein
MRTAKQHHPRNPERSRPFASLSLFLILLAQFPCPAPGAGPAQPDFGPARHALLFAPGEYKVDVPVGYYTQVLGLGASPDDVHIAGDVRSDATLPNNNATCTFWKAAEGFSVTPAGGTMQWAVSQAVPFRRMHVRGDIVLHQKNGWASGGWMLYCQSCASRVRKRRWSHSAAGRVRAAGAETAGRRESDLLELLPAR